MKTWAKVRVLISNAIVYHIHSRLACINWKTRSILTSIFNIDL